MKSFKNVSDSQFQLPPPGNYRSKVVAATAKESAKSGAPMVEIEVEIVEPEQFAGVSARDWILTDPSGKGASIAKRKLIGLGVDVNSDEEYPDSVLAQRLLGREVWVTFKHEPRMDKDANGGYTIPVYEMVNGHQTPKMNLRVEKYGGVVNRAPQAQAPAVQYNPGMQSSPQQQAVFQQQFQAAPSTVPQYPQQAQQAQFQQQFAPQQQAPAQFPQFANGGGQALPPWMQMQQGVPGAAPTEAPSEEPKKRRKN